ncbi:MAG: tRNA-dihydrouridine synthase [Candidatus Saccharimonadales bacterium]
MKNFWNELPHPFFILAPMEAVTDVVFRHVVARAASPDVWFTEFTNATGWHHAGDKAIGGRLIKTVDENPIVAQLWGADPIAMEALARHCAELGYDGIDINMGCPDASATKSGGGSGMILTPENASAIISAAKKSGLPVSVKTRLGYSKLDEWHEWISHILSQDIANFTIHLRTKKEMSKVPAHYELISDIKKLRDEIAPQTLLTINGDIRDRKHGLELVEQYGVDGIMIGRGIFTNPFAFADTPDNLTNEQLNAETSPGKMVVSQTTDGNQIQKIELLRLQLNLYDNYSEQTGRPFETLKRFFKIYIRDFEGASELRDQLMHTSSTDEVRQLVARFKD